MDMFQDSTLREGSAVIAPTLLVIEADSALQTLIATIVSQVGYNVHTTMPEDYLYMVQQLDPAGIILSCDPYGMAIPGWDLAYILRCELPRARLIMLSTDPEAVEEVGVTPRGLQFSGALRKPFLAEELLDLVARCFQPEHQPLHRERAS
jgi:DNA-binding response OmpR family regulator